MVFSGHGTLSFKAREVLSQLTSGYLILNTGEAQIPQSLRAVGMTLSALRITWGVIKKPQAWAALRPIILDFRVRTQGSVFFQALRWAIPMCSQS